MADGPTSLDMLAAYGALDVDGKAFLTGEPSRFLTQRGFCAPPDPSLSIDPNMLQRQPSNDQYTSEAIQAELNKETETPITDTFKPQVNDSSYLPQIDSYKKWSAAALGTYILGFVLSGFKKNPVHWIKPIGNLMSGTVNIIRKIFKS